MIQYFSIAFVFLLFGVESIKPITKPITKASLLSFWKTDGVGVFLRSFGLESPRNSKNPDKTDFPGKSGTLSGKIRPDFSLKNPVCPDILAILIVGTLPF